MSRGDDLYHLDEGALSGPRRRPRRHPGPVRGLRGRRVGGRRRAGPPGLHRRGAHHRPAHHRRGVRLDRHPRQGDRPRGRGGRAGRRRCGSACRRYGDAWPGRAAAAGDAAGVDRPAVRAGPLGAGDDRGRRRRAAARHGRREVASGSPGRRSTRPSPRWSWWRRAASTGRGRRPSPTSWSRAARCPTGVPVHAVDANASWARPGTRLVDGVEELERVLYAVNDEGFLNRVRMPPTI